MAWLHTWCGLVSGWLLCAIFMTVGPSVLGAATTRWVQAQPPEQAAATAAEASRMGCDLRILLHLFFGARRHSMRSRLAATSTVNAGWQICVFASKCSDGCCTPPRPAG